MEGNLKYTNTETSSKYRNLSFRGQSFVGVVVSDKGTKSATVEFTRKYYLPKYERYESRKTRLHVHNPPHIHAKEGDIVRVMETRPLSKTIHHVIVEKVGEEKTYKGRKMVEEEEKAKTVKGKAKEEVKSGIEKGAKKKEAGHKPDAKNEN